jgi:hypothetical protein
VKTHLAHITMAVELELFRGTAVDWFRGHKNPRKRCMGEVLDTFILKQVVRIVTIVLFNS